MDRLHRQTLGDTLRRTARRLPHKTALVFRTRTWTYAELDADCNRVAHGLAGLGIAKGDRVAILSRNSAEFVLIRFALARLGAVLVPINFMLGPEEVGFVLRHAGARFLCVAPDLADTATRAVVLDTCVERLISLGDAPSGTSGHATWVPFETLLRARTDEPEVDVRDDDLAQIVYTSGTESLPKGAMLTHEAVLWEYVSCVVEGEIATTDRVLHALPLYHCAQLDVFLGPSVYVGATSVITGKPTPDNILALLEKHGCNSFFAPPSIWIALLRSPAFDKTDLTRFAKGYYGASIMPVAVLEEIGRRLPKVRLWNFYGQTEIAPLATVLKPGDQVRKAGSAGRAVINVETRVVDDQMRDVRPASGEVGEIVHRSPQLLDGYYDDEQRTADAFAGG